MNKGKFVDGPSGQFGMTTQELYEKVLAPYGGAWADLTDAERHQVEATREDMEEQFFATIST